MFVRQTQCKARSRAIRVFSRPSARTPLLGQRRGLWIAGVCCDMIQHDALASISNEDSFVAVQRLTARSNVALADLLAHLGEVERRGIHRSRACASLYTYCIYRALRALVQQLRARKRAGTKVRPLEPAGVSGGAPDPAPARAADVASDAAPARVLADTVDTAP